MADGCSPIGGADDLEPTPVIEGGRCAGRCVGGGLAAGTAHGSEAAADAESVNGPGAAAHPESVNGSDAPKHIALLNLHTDERLEIEFFRDGAFLPEALSAIEVLLRDFRTGEQHAIDPELMSYLVQVAHSAGVDPAFSVISGYRLCADQRAVARAQLGSGQTQSAHGRPSHRCAHGRVDCASLAAHALDLRRGGVGYYRVSDFVHLDTGAFRTWKG